MNKLFSRTLLVAGIIGSAGVASAITFSDINIAGPSNLIGTVNAPLYSINSGDCDIDFSFWSAFVGDNLPSRLGVITITFEVKAGANEWITGVDLAASAVALGSGTVQITEQVEDFTNGGAALTGGGTATASTPGTIIDSLTLAKPSKWIKVKKTIFLDALQDTAVQDLAGIGLVEQRIHKVVPEPGSVLAIGAGLAALVARRRKNS